MTLRTTATADRDFCVDAGSGRSQCHVQKALRAYRDPLTLMRSVCECVWWWSLEFVCMRVCRHWGQKCVVCIRPLSLSLGALVRENADAQLFIIDLSAFAGIHRQCSRVAEWMETSRNIRTMGEYGAQQSMQIYTHIRAPHTLGAWKCAQRADWQMWTERCDHR